MYNPTKQSHKLQDIDLQSTISALEENEYIHHQVLQTIAAAIYSCDVNGYITFYNKAAVELWGREPEIGKDLWCGSWKIYEPDNITPLPLDSCPMAIVLKEGIPVRGRDIIVERPDGVRRNIMPYPDPLFNRNGEVIGAVNLLVDITELKQKENELKETHKQVAADLEVKVNQRTNELRETNSALERSNSELEQFAFIASHDLQEPLRKINTFSERIEQRLEKDADPTTMLYLSKIKKSSRQMSLLISDILNYSRLIHANAGFESTDLNEILNNKLEDFELIIEQRNVAITSDKLPVVKAIPLHMSQLFHNLLSNSLKFCEEDKICKLKISCRSLTKQEITNMELDEHTSYHEIVFKDNGIGFEQEYAENIFRIFERLNPKDLYNGSGIGLALCKKIMDMHNGKIFARSEPRMGTSIHIVLPS